jgi:hypothetical protein
MGSDPASPPYSFLIIRRAPPVRVLIVDEGSKNDG